MKTQVGLWIDHRRAVVVTISGGTENITQIPSNVEKQEQSSGTAQDSAPEDQRDRRFLDHLNKYYDEVISHIRGAESILVLGPGEAKGEFVKRLQRDGRNGRIEGIEAADKMTDRQIAARVRQQFLATN